MELLSAYQEAAASLLFGRDKEDSHFLISFSGRQSLGAPSTPSSLGRGGAAHGTQSREMNSLLQSLLSVWK